MGYPVERHKGRMTRGARKHRRRSVEEAGREAAETRVVEPLLLDCGSRENKRVIRMYCEGKGLTGFPYFPILPQPRGRAMSLRRTEPPVCTPCPSHSLRPNVQ